MIATSVTRSSRIQPGRRQFREPSTSNIRSTSVDWQIGNATRVTRQTNHLSTLSIWETFRCSNVLSAIRSSSTAQNSRDRSSLCNLRVLCVSVVDYLKPQLTTETQRIQRLHKEISTARLFAPSLKNTQTPAINQPPDRLNFRIFTRHLRCLCEPAGKCTPKVPKGRILNR